MSKTLSLKTTVSDLHLCQRCPRLLAKKLSGDLNVWRVGLKGSSFCGKIFHDNIAAPFHRDAAKQRGLKKRREIIDLFISNADDRQAMRKTFFDHIYRTYLFPYLVENSQNFESGQIDAFSTIIERWGDFLINFFLSNPGFRDDPATFTNYAFSLPPEKNMKANFAAADDTILTIGGRFDSALLDKTNSEVLLVEYKCRRETDHAEDIVQLALYAWLIWQDTGVRPRASILYLEESEPEATYSAKDMEDIIQQFSSLFDCAIQVIRANKLRKEYTPPKTSDPRLCKVCHYANDCAR